MNKPLTGVTRRKLRSSEWFNNPHNPGMTALYLERYLNYGLTRHELQAGKPIIGIAQTGNGLSPCNRHPPDPKGQFQGMGGPRRKVGAGLGDAAEARPRLQFLDRFPATGKRLAARRRRS